MKVGSKEQVSGDDELMAKKKKKVKNTVKEKQGQEGRKESNFKLYLKEVVENEGKVVDVLEDGRVPGEPEAGGPVVEPPVDPPDPPDAMDEEEEGEGDYHSDTSSVCSSMSMGPIQEEGAVYSEGELIRFLNTTKGKKNVSLDSFFPDKVKFIRTWLRAGKSAEFAGLTPKKRYR